MEFLNLIQVRDIIGDYANINFDENMNVSYKCCDICYQVADKYFHVKTDPLYIINGKRDPLIMKHNPYDTCYILVKENIREEHFPTDMIWVQHKEVIKLKDKEFSDMEYLKFYKYICNIYFFENEFISDFIVITHCENCKKSAIRSIEDKIINIQKLIKK